MITRISEIPNWFINSPNLRQANFPNIMPKFTVANNKLTRWDAETYVEWGTNVSDYGWNRVNNIEAGGLQNGATYVYFQYDGPFYDIAKANGFTYANDPTKGDIFAHFDSAPAYDGGGPNTNPEIIAIAEKYLHLLTNLGSNEVVLNGEFPATGGQPYNPYSITQKILKGFGFAIQKYNANNNTNIKIGWWSKGKYGGQLPLYWESLPDSVAIQRYKGNYGAIYFNNKNYYFSDSSWNEWLIGQEVDYIGHSNHTEAGLYSLCQYFETGARSGATEERQHMVSRWAQKEQPQHFNEQDSIRLYRYRPEKGDIADNIDNKTMRTCMDNFNTGLALAIFSGFEYWGFGRYTRDKNKNGPYIYPAWVDWFTNQTDWLVLGMYFTSHASVKTIIEQDHIWELPEYSFDGVQGMTVTGDNVYPAKGRIDNVKPNGLPIVRFKKSTDGTQAVVYICYPRNPNANNVDVTITIPSLNNSTFTVRGGWAELYHVTL